MGHDRSRPPPKEDDEEEDPIDKMLDKSGCKELHFAVQVSLSSAYIDCIIMLRQISVSGLNKYPKENIGHYRLCNLFRVDFIK